MRMWSRGMPRVLEQTYCVRGWLTASMEGDQTASDQLIRRVYSGLRREPRSHIAKAGLTRRLMHRIEDADGTKGAD